MAKMGMVDPFMLYSHYHELHWSWNGSQTSHRFLNYPWANEQENM
jgi:hypothetical protein